MSHYGNDLLFESIQIRDGIPQRLDLHQARMDRSHKHHFGEVQAISLSSSIEVPREMQRGLVKCRVTYGESVSSIEFEQYTPRAHERITVVEDDSIAYSFKYTDRHQLKVLEDSAPRQAIIIAEHGQLTDATYANIALHDGERWVTPSRVLLQGVMREWLLERGMIEEAEIRLSELPRYSSIKLINAMLEWDDSPTIPLQGYHLV